jgi:hypothetical protein
VYEVWLEELDRQRAQDRHDRRLAELKAMM